jgi:hypothetical protein
MPGVWWEEEIIMAKMGSKKRVVPQHSLFKKHPRHNRHLCELVARREMDAVAGLSKGAKYICHICGRASAKAASVCEPVQI